MVHALRRSLSLVLVASLAAGCGHTAAMEKNIKLAKISCEIASNFISKHKLLQAKQELLKAVKLDPENSDAHKLLGYVKLAEGLRSLYYIDRIQCLEGDEVDEHRQVANKHMRQSEKSLLESIRLAKKNNIIASEALSYLANVMFHFKRYDDSVKYAAQGLERSFYPQRHMLHSIKGWAHFQKKEYREAGEDLRQAIFHLPKFCLGRYRLAKVYFARKKYDRAIKELEWTAKEKCPIQEAPYLLGRAYAQKRSMDKAQKQFQRCASMNPKSCLSKVCERLARDATRSTVQIAE